MSAGEPLDQAARPESFDEAGGGRRSVGAAISAPERSAILSLSLPVLTFVDAVLLSRYGRASRQIVEV